MGQPGPFFAHTHGGSSGLANPGAGPGSIADEIGARAERVTDLQVRQFAEDGAVTIDTPLTVSQIAAAPAAMERQRPFQPPEEGQQPRQHILAA